MFSRGDFYAKTELPYRRSVKKTKKFPHIIFLHLLIIIHTFQNKIFNTSSKILMQISCFLFI